MKTHFIFLLSLLILNPVASFAGLPGRDTTVDYIRKAMQGAKTPSVADVVNKKWNCSFVEAIEGFDTPVTTDGPNFLIQDGMLVNSKPESMFGDLAFTYTGYGLINLTPQDEKYTWMTVYRKTSDGKLIMEMSLNPKGQYKQAPSVVDPRYFAKSYEICTEKK